MTNPSILLLFKYGKIQDGVAKMNAVYVQWAKAVEAKMKADNGPDFCHDRQLAKAAFAMGLSVEEAAASIAEELAPRIAAQKADHKAALDRLFVTVGRAVKA